MTGAALGGVFVACAALTTAPAQAETSATVKVHTQRMADANLNVAQNAWYDQGDQLTLVCSQRGQSVTGHLNPSVPTGGWNDLWYKTSDGSFVPEVYIDTGALGVVAPDCGDGQPVLESEPASTNGPTTGRTTNVNRATPGQCTDGAMQKWFQAAGSYPALSGNAKDWPASARASGWTVTDDAQPRSLVVFQPGVQGAADYGHVAWVNSTSQRPDGLYLNITEMNNAQYGGVGAWHTRDVKHVPTMTYILLP